MKRQRKPVCKTVVEQVVDQRAPSHLTNGSGATDFDVVVCGGNLGIAIALALQKRGHRVLVVERRLLVG